MGNPQERSLTWLAAVIECEGSISAQIYTLPDGRVRVTPFVCVVNSDEGILAEVARILDQNGIKWRKCKHKGARVPVSTYRLDGLKPVKAVLDLILPYLIGEKKRNARNILEFIASRAARGVERNEKGHCRRVEYSAHEIDLVTEFRTHARAKSSETTRQAPNVIG